MRKHTARREGIRAPLTFSVVQPLPTRTRPADLRTKAPPHANARPGTTPVRKISYASQAPTTFTNTLSYSALPAYKISNSMCPLRIGTLWFTLQARNRYVPSSQDEIDVEPTRSDNQSNLAAC